MNKTNKTTERRNEIMAELKDENPELSKIFEEYKIFKYSMDEFLGFMIPEIVEMTVSSGTSID